jgi:hypothetical protein
MNRGSYQEEEITTRRKTTLVDDGWCVAEVDVEPLDAETERGPCLSLEGTGCADYSGILARFAGQCPAVGIPERPQR